MASVKKFEIEAEIRKDIGKGASRRLRREDKLPGVLYGGGKEAVSLVFDHHKVAKSLDNEAFYSHILTLKTGTESERVILKDLQRHPYKRRLLHLDLQRVRADEKLYMNVPLHFVGADKAPGVKEGGLISHIETDVEVACFPDNLPEFIEIDISGMELNDILHLSDIKLPHGVELPDLMHDNDKPIVSVHVPRVEEEPVEVTEAPPPSEVPAMAQKSEESPSKEPKESK